MSTATLAPAPQWVGALSRANAVRTERAELKRKIRTRELDLRAVIKEPPAIALGIPIYELVLELPRVGTYRMERILRGVCRHSLTLEHMSDYTRRQLVFKLDEIAP